MTRRPSTSAHGTGRRWVKPAVIVVVLVVLATWGVAFYWSRTPDAFNVVAAAGKDTPKDFDPTSVTGYTTAATLANVVQTLLDKPGGYLSNDVLPPSVLMDDMPNWEYGVIIQVRDLAQSMRNDLSRSRSQSKEDPDLAIAEPQFNFPNNSWMFPASENEYRKGIKAVHRYMRRLADPNDQSTQFYARADNLSAWLGLVNKRLGGLSQRLTASVGQYRVNTDLAGDASATQATSGSDEVYSQTPWLEIDDVFYQARGATWALIEFMRAVEIDFHDVLKNKNALVSLRQVIRELEQTQRPLYSPIVLNGNGFGFFANHSLTMASYIARANAALIDLQQLLNQG
ncbi:MAG TPA: DUF2333 family protein [Gammaproteobacteria bacterium]|nr:DUF2333 family protein [Gammaproteobacteria bacterium]